VWKQSSKRRSGLQTQKDKTLRHGLAVYLGLFLIYIFPPPQLHAQPSKKTTTNSSDSAQSVPIEEIRVQAFRYVQKINRVPGALTIIPAAHLREVPAQQIDFVLNQVAGVYMQSGSLNTNRFTIRGIGGRSPYASNKVRAYFEDIPLTNGTGETTLEDLDQSLIENIEIIKGPASGFYGSGLGGTLLLQPDMIAQNGFTMEGSLASYNRQNYRATIKMKGGNWKNALYLDQLNADGYRKNNETERTNLSYIGRYEAGNHQFNLILLQTDLRAYIPSSIDWKTFQNAPREAAPNWAAVRGYEDYQKQLVGFSVQSVWGNNFSSRLSLFGHRKSSDELRPFNFLKEDNHYFGLRVLAQKKWQINKARTITLSLGNESFWENYDWKTFDTETQRITLSDNKEKRNYFNIFSQFNFTTSRLRISSGINVNQTNYRYRDLYFLDDDQSANHRFEPVVSPRLAASYSVSQQVSVYGNISHGFSPPGLEETLLPDGQRNTEIKPETGWNTEIGIRGTFSNSFFFDLSVYYMEIKNLLVARRTTEDAYIGMNAGKTKHPGIEVSLNYQWINRINFNSALRFAGNYSPYKFKSFKEDENDYSGNDLTGSPRARINLVSENRFKPNLQVLLQYQFTDRIPLRDDNSIYADAYHLVNLTANYRKNWDQLELTCSASLLNLTDTHYASMVLINASSFGNQPPRYYYPGLPRHFSSRISLKYLF